MVVLYFDVPKVDEVMVNHSFPDYINLFALLGVWWSFLDDFFNGFSWMR
jgi:hypothetical protein